LSLDYNRWKLFFIGKLKAQGNSLVALGLFFVLLAILLVAIAVAILGIILVSRHRADKTQPLLKYGINLPVNIQLIVGTALIALSAVFIFWVAWSAIEWIMVRL